jgi:hypothetical protein
MERAAGELAPLTALPAKRGSDGLASPVGDRKWSATIRRNNTLLVNNQLPSFSFPCLSRTPHILHIQDGGPISLVGRD